MNRKYIRSLSVFLAFVMILGSVFVGVPNVVWAEGETCVETFDNSTATGSYADGSFVGENGVTWSYVHSRNEDIYPIEGKGIMLRRQSSGSKITSSSIPGGISSISVDYRKAYTGGTARQLEFLINGTSIGITEVFGNFSGADATIFNFEVDNLNISGDFTIEIVDISEGQITIDNITWTSFSGGEPEPPRKVAQVTATPSSGEVEENTFVELSTATEDAEIYYTTDGNDPTIDSTTYTEPIIITEAVTIKAIAVKEAMESSDISTFNYTIKSPISIEPIATAKVKANGEEVIVEGVVTGLIGNNAFIQDNTAGIYLYNGNTSKSGLVVGNKVIVKGKLSEFSNLKQIENSEIQEVVSTGNKLPTPFSVTIPEITEEYESSLVKVDNLTIKSIPAPTQTPSSYSIIATDGVNDIELRVDRNLNPPITLPLDRFEVGDNIIVTAPVGQYGANYQLMIRTIEDITKKGITTEDLFISEYIEGSSYNKAIEIFNGTGSMVDLSGYKVELYTNGATSPGSKLDLSGTLNHGDVYVIAHGQAVQEIKDKADITSGVVNFNGNDAVVLKHNDEIIDVFGQVGFDPGKGWGEGDVTLDHTLVRKGSITKGDTSPDDEFDPLLEWDVYPKDTFSFLGSHTIGEDSDKIAPEITHIPVTDGNINEDLTVSATVTDNRKVESVKLYYRIKGIDVYTIANMSLDGNKYSYTILKDELSSEGLEYYIEASDGVNISRSPEDVDTPYEVTISDEDIYPPRVTNLTPVSGSSTGANYRPEISAEYSDQSGINTESIKLFLDDEDVTLSATITESRITYIPDTDLLEGYHTVRLRVSDNASTPQTATVEWSFYVGEREYNFYFGQLHSHTNLSDGQGTPDDAYSWARDRGNADFFAVTDHSNWFDNDTGSENITEVSQSTSEKWKTLNAKANQYNKDNEYVAIAGYEMTWSGSTGGWGHINTFNTPWFASRSNSKMNLQAYYNKISQWPESINQLNHPGKTFGDFGDFGFYSEAADNVVQLIEVGNGEGPIRGSGYFPSYEYYTRALDKGWHLAPSNNQDNHKGNWVTSNEARNVILSETLTRDSIYEGIRDLRVYATENKNLEIMYKINGQIMGSRLSSPDKLNFSISVNEPDVNDEMQKIAKIDIISNGGVIAATKTFNSHYVDWNFELNPMYDYYYVKVTQANKDISVTSPIWVGEVLPVGISGLEASSSYFELGNSIDLSATIYNNGENILANAKIEFYLGSISEGNKIGEETVKNIGQGASGKATIRWTPEIAGDHNIYAVATIDGVDKQFTASIKVEVVLAGSAVKVMVDFAHKNHYVSGGDYADRIESFKEMLKGKNMIMVENHNVFTDEALNDIDILVITSPQPIDRGAIPRAKLSDEEIEVVKRFTDRGGSLILTSRANYSDGTGDYQNSVQGNKLLNAIGSNVIFNSDQVIDDINNGGQAYRLYFETYTSEKFNLTPGLTNQDLYSFYSGCSVLLKDGGNDENVDFLVKGHSTTKNDNAGKVGTGHIPLSEGNVHVIAAEELPSGGKLIISGSTFFSDFEMSGDNRYTNIEIADNVLEWLKPVEDIEVKTIKEVRDGMPSNFGQRFAVEGRVTAMSEAYSKANNLANAFFEVIYVQDETGGITVFGVSNTVLPLGTKVRITGTAGEYEGDYQLQIGNESIDLIILDDEVVEIVPKEMSTLDSMKKTNEGWLVKIKGIVTRINLTNNSLYIDDGSGEAMVYVNGYIGDGSGDEAKLGKWDPSIKVGDTVSAIGLASTDPVGPRLRIRNTAEIVKETVVEHEYPLTIGVVEKIQGEEITTVKVNVANHKENEISGVVIVKLIDANGRAYSVVYQNAKIIKGQNLVEFNLNSADYPKGIKEIKVYIWDSLTNMKPLSKVK